MEGPYEGRARLPDIQVDEDLWGPGSAPIVTAWLRDNYDPDTMPRLQVAQITGREGLWLMGWDAEPSLLETIFGRDYALAQLDQAKALRDDLDGITRGSFGQGRL